MRDVLDESQGPDESQGIGPTVAADDADVPAGAGWRAGLAPRLGRQLDFLMEIDRLKAVLRCNRLADASRRENSAEHSWHLAMFALVLEEYAVGPVDLGRVLTMLLTHDIIEVDSGDTPIHDPVAVIGQAEREQAAAERLFGLLPDDQGNRLKALWQEFEAAESADARFAKALDRFQPILMNHASGGGSWTDFHVHEGQVRRVSGALASTAPDLWTAAQAVFRDAVAKGWLRAAP